MRPTQKLFPPVIRNIDAANYFENFFIFSILSVVGIRIFLQLSGFPQLGDGGLHIAHMLWGGLLMMAALFISFLFLNKALHQVASVLAGIGFGTFIDELGKFITADYNYFYQPAFSWMYLIFVLIYLAFHMFRVRTRFSKAEYLANAVEATKEVMIQDFDTEEKQAALTWLAQADPKHRYTQALEKIVRTEKPVAVKPSLAGLLRGQLHMWYRLIVTRQWLPSLAVGFFALQVIGYLVLMTLLIVYQISGRGIVIELRLGLFGWGLVASSTLAIYFLIRGLWNLTRTANRRKAYRLFNYSLLTNILLVTFFAFYFHQIIALLNVMINIIFLKTFEYAAEQEKTLGKVSS